MSQNSTLLDAIWQKPVDHTPVWLMRQAGRYLPEYLKIRAQAGSFLNLCKTPDWATEVTLQPLRRFNLDAAILFSDILVIPEAMGMELNFVENEGPKFSSPITSEQDIDNLNLDEMLDKLNYVFSTVKNLKGEMDNKTPLIGFSGSPFTLACYMLEGGASKNYLKIKQWLYLRPDLAHKLLAKLTQAIIRYLNAQIDAGVDVVMLFDSWGGILTDRAYQEFSLYYLNQIVSELDLSHGDKIIPSIVFTKGGGQWLDKIEAIGADVIGIDWTLDIGQARSIVKSTALQGNLDPVILATCDKNVLKNEVTKILNNYKKANNGSISGHVFNLGHGILPMTNPDNVAYLVDLVHDISHNIRVS